MKSKKIIKQYYCKGCQNPVKGCNRWCSPECRKETLFLQKAFKNDRYAPAKLRIFILKRDRFRCQYCKREVTYEEANIDHVKPWPFGKTVPENLVTSCQECNKTKYARRGLELVKRRGQIRLRIDRSGMRKKNNIGPVLKVLLPELKQLPQQGPMKPFHKPRPSRELAQLISSQIKDMEKSHCDLSEIRQIKAVLRKYNPR